MAVYTEVSNEELDSFIAEYDIGAVRACKGIAEGVENSNFLLQTTGGNYFLTLYEKRVKAEDLPYFLGLLDHLVRQGIKCPTPITGRDGKALRHLAGRPAALFNFVDGLWIKRPNAHHCGALGQALAKLHLAGKDFPMRRENALSVGGWRPIFEHCRAKADTVQVGLTTYIEQELQFLERVWPKDLPQGVIHADLFPDNVLFVGDKLSWLIDFYFACNDAFAYDIAICLNAWCFEGDSSFNVTKAKAMLHAYKAVRPLESREADALPKLARGAALRFLLTRLYDLLNVPQGALVKPKDPLEYAKKLRFHQDVENPDEYGLTA
jgi:homoserine kinase type II